MKKITVITRENRNGLWWSSTTYEGMDYYEESDNPILSAIAMKEKLISLRFDGEISFSMPQWYMHSESESTEPFKKPLLDEGMV